MISNFTLSCTHAPFWLGTTCPSAVSASCVLLTIDSLVDGLARQELHAYSSSVDTNFSSSIVDTNFSQFDMHIW